MRTAIAIAQRARARAIVAACRAMSARFRAEVSAETAQHLRGTAAATLIRERARCKSSKQHRS
jgi:hypothetical protein